MMNLRLLPSEFVICKATDFSQVNLAADFLFIAKTDEEYSIVCPAGDLPSNHISVEPSWRAFRIEGVLDFSLVGIIAQLSAILAARDIGLFVVSTFNTDYILIKAHQLELAIEALEQDGYRFVK